MATAHKDMKAAPEETAFLAYKERPSNDRLAALLAAVQDRVYNICFQILRRPEDAEDACQEVLIELTRGLAKINEPRPFKVWLYRVAVHTSLDRKEALARQARLASRAPAPEGPPMNEEERAELMRAIRSLDDRTRCLVLEHYFDKLTLEEIGAREGISGVAVFKRLDRARETLRRALLGAGFTVSVAQCLEAVTPVAAPASLAAKSALIAGGVVVGTKSAVSAGIVVAAVLLTGAASTGGYLAGNSRAEARVRELQDHVTRLSRPKESPTNTAPVTASAPAPESAPAATSPVPETASLNEKEREPRRRRAIDLATVKFGRPSRADHMALRNAETWDDFYKKAKEQKTLTSSDFEDLVFERVMRDLQADANTSQAVRRIFDAEREEATRAIIEAAGGADALDRVLTEGGYWNQVKPEWSRLRDDVRRARNLDYLKLLTYDQLQYFNEHLRNAELSFETSYGSEGTHFIVTGVGKPVK